MRKIFLSLILLIGAATGFTQNVTTNGGSGLSATYPSIASAINALNAATISSPVIITAVTVNEIALAGGYVITAQGTSSNTIQIVSKGSVVTASNAQAAGSLTDAVFKLVGADYVTLRDWTIQENAANTITDSTTNNMTEWGVAVLYASQTNGAQNNTIQNNAISLNNTYANAFGIYASTAHSSTDVKTLADITNSTGGNDNLKIYSNTISNVNIPVAIIGSPSFPGIGLDLGGSSAATANSLANWGNSNGYSAFVRLSNQVYGASGTSIGFFNAVSGIFAVNQIAPNISYNNITSSAPSGITDGVMLGIYAPTNGTIVYPASANTTNINYNTLALSSPVNATIGNGTTSVPLIQGIRMMTGDNNNTLNINNNNFTAINHSIANAVGSDTLIYTLAQPLNLNINNNQFSNLSIGNTGSVIVIGIHGSVYMPVNGTQNINNNSIVGNFQRTGITATTPGITVMVQRPGNSVSGNSIGSASGSSFTAQNNNFSNVSTNGGAFTAFANFDGRVGEATLSKSVLNNTVSSIVTTVVNTTAAPTTVVTSGTISGVQFTNKGQLHTVSNNTFASWTSIGKPTTSTPNANGSINGILSASGVVGMSLTASGNTFQDFAGGGIIGINVPAETLVVTNNKMLGFNGAATTGTAAVAGIAATSLLTGSTVTISGNKIGNLSNTPAGAGPAFNGTVAGINLAAGSAAYTETVKINNNLIGDLKAPNSTTYYAINGIIIGTGAFTSEVAFNTVHLNASSSSATTFGTTCLQFTNSTNANLTLKNNILYNASTPAQEGLNLAANGVSAALRLSAGSAGSRPTYYNNGSNNNLFYVRASAGTNNHLSYVEGTSSATLTNAQNTLANLQSFLTPSDANSVTENTTNNPFLSVDPTNTKFLHMNPGYISAANNAGAAVAGITVDYDGETRNATTPDIGADEYTQNANAIPLPVSLALLNGHKQGSDNVLTWSTLTETNNRGFDILRSADGRSFTNIGTVITKAANGNSSSRIDYSFTDRNVAAGRFYYRLQQKDINGQSKLSNVVLISDAAMKAGVSGVYPNPAINVINLSVNATATDNVQLMISDVNGKIIRQQLSKVMTGSNSIGMDISKLPAGYYNLTIQMKELGKSVTERFIKQ